VTLSVGLFVAIGLPVLACIIAIYVMAIASAVATSNSRHPDPTLAAAPLLLIYLGLLGVFLLMLPISALLMGGMYKAAFKQLRGGQVEFRDLFSARDQFFPLLGAILLHALCVGVASLFCIIPGYIVSGLLMFTIPLVLERKMGIIDAMQASREVTQKNWLMFTLYAFVVQLIASLGTYACYIGILATWPLMFTMTVVAYRDCFGLPGALSFAGPSAQPPGYYQTPPSGYAPPTYAPPPPGYPPPPAPYPPPGAGYSAPPPGVTPSAAPPSQTSLTCPRCQAALPVGAVFCANCGATVGK